MKTWRSMEPSETRPLTSLMLNDRSPLIFATVKTMSVNQQFKDLEVLQIVTERIAINDCVEIFVISSRRGLSKQKEETKKKKDVAIFGRPFCRAHKKLKLRTDRGVKACQKQVRHVK